MPESEEEFGLPVPFGVYAATGQLLGGIDEAALTGKDAQQKHLHAKLTAAAPRLGYTTEADPNDVSEAGWCIMFSASADERIREALQPLIDHRWKQVGDERLFKIFDGATACEPGQTATGWLSKRGVSMNVVNPLQGVPYYTLLVGPPEEISFEFQYSLDIFWAVGRLWFPTAEEFRQYAESVIRYETMAVVPTARQMAIFSPSNDYDAATQLFSRQVATRLMTGTNISKPVGKKQQFVLQTFIGDLAEKQVPP